MTIWLKLADSEHNIKIGRIGVKTTEALHAEWVEIHVLYCQAGWDLMRVAKEHESTVSRIVNEPSQREESR